MKEKDIPVTYVLYPDEGHGFARPENNLSFFAIAEAFLAGRLEGRYEPIGDDFNDSSLQVLEGADAVPGLADSLPTKSEIAHKSGCRMWTQKYLAHLSGFRACLNLPVQSVFCGTFAWWLDQESAPRDEVTA